MWNGRKQDHKAIGIKSKYVQKSRNTTAKDVRIQHTKGNNSIDVMQEYQHQQCKNCIRTLKRKKRRI